MNLDVTIWAAFGAGLLSFLSPCVLPLVPPYLCFLAGAELDDLTAVDGDNDISYGKVLMVAFTFVLGFSTVFVGLGATASVFGQLLREHLQLLAQIAGVIIIIMGLHFLGVFRFALLAREARYHHASRPAGLAGAYAIGVAFAFGWTPCIGPVLAAILAIAATEESVSSGAFLLFIYSMGLGVPFLLAALGMERFLEFAKKFRPYLPTVEKAMGGLLVLTGVAFMTGAMQSMAYWLLEAFPGLANLG
ncbi:MAG: cytochrome c biogenesis CcdA family protein [Hyphomicrobiales bacterium]|nr:cytochrome c biogenesis CcdA family protein [Hyphomicrobiales bacterium]